MAKKVFLGVGHGGKDPGAVKFLKEADVNLNMAIGCRDYLVANGVEVKMSREDNSNDTLTEEINECNAYNPDLAVDIHNNAGGGDGFEVYHSYKGGTSKILAQNIESEVKAIGQNSRGCKTRMNSKGNADYYGFIRQTKAPAVITEGLFVDNANDVTIADTVEEQKAFGMAIAKGILKTLGIVSSNVPQATNSPSPATATGSVPIAHVMVTCEELNIRKGAGVKNGIVAKAYKGGEYDVFEIKGDWGRINGGWFNLKYTTYAGNLKTTSTVPTVSYYPKCSSKYTSIVDALNSIGVDSSKANRKKIAAKNGIANYTFSGSQNTKLLSLLKNGKLIKV